jgi:hypothetical protein
MGENGRVGLLPADLVWNRACEVQLRAFGLGDAHLWALLRVHGCIMNGGTMFAAEVLDQDDFDAARAACVYFELPEIADVVSRIAGMDDDGESAMNDRYYGLVPRDQVLSDAFERRYVSSPDDFDALS